MFSASVLVPILFGIPASIVLLMNGVGTLLFILITKGRAPAYLGSSFAFLSPGFIVIGSMGYQYCLGGFICAGAIFCIVAIIIKFAGVNWIDAVLPPAAMGPIVALIGLELAGSAASTGGIVSSGEGAAIDPKFVFVFIFTLALAVIWTGRVQRIRSSHSDPYSYRFGICTGSHHGTGRFCSSFRGKRIRTSGIHAS